ncbi:DUF29 domain-containing protein [Dolichospermum sp. ST_sed1]|jgi:hypothetical protein|nr:DUF29 domain-containing protein [Dolichospermum sp. ST_sed1]MDD1423991.1 DUF29 domain-containing protein [Dolichospermum sp. ST_sed9]MDD1430515.1 DUF29 domain-containing protein [Dolichospermum sp. ST_sed6]MDD1438039.1 DUF29 domain-containing protein [Dolichospermum sp. ST_sed10]MDD1439916.1 DUF29 domain-containing protein [Dolichospermum sp. ST_sed3]MDD1445705.1 DUF29 domain-containing protein [Dolichospermum sp. ST_sed8]MDD1454090.1 DUF29 domain-containing protein [Dolichospermum sp. ST_
MTVNTDLQSLYEIDESLWLEETVILLKEKRFQDLDLNNLIEELEALGKRDKNAVASLLEQIIRHLLLLQYWTEEYETNGNHWRTEIIGFRNQLERLLTNNLQNYLHSELEKIYKSTLKYVKQKTRFKIDFPEHCPYSLEQILDETYL